MPSATRLASSCGWRASRVPGVPARRRTSATSAPNPSSRFMSVAGGYGVGQEEQRQGVGFPPVGEARPAAQFGRRSGRRWRGREGGRGRVEPEVEHVHDPHVDTRRGCARSEAHAVLGGLGRMKGRDAARSGRGRAHRRSSPSTNTASTRSVRRPERGRLAPVPRTVRAAAQERRPHGGRGPRSGGRKVGDGGRTRPPSPSRRRREQQPRRRSPPEDAARR